jgi:small subunit ribosomal protein S20
LAHSRSSRKRWRQSLERRARNRSTKSRTRTLVTKALIFIDDEPTGAEDAVKAAISSLDRAAQKGVIHPNAAARSKSRLLKRFNLAVAGQVAAAASAPPAPASEPPAAAPRRSRSRSASTESSEQTPPAPRSRSRRTT